jgi:rhamnose utilization protein RhaD (predicted bifunctional aldolase and dehydrogenase)
MKKLKEIVILAQKYGNKDHVIGGGGNISTKTTDHLYIKPSGTLLCNLSEDSLVQLDRTRLSKVLDIDDTVKGPEREKHVKSKILSSIVGERQLRPSVESPLHNLLDWTFVLHTHSSIVNGLTCSIQGKQNCLKLFPDSIWVDYCDPGFILCKTIQGKLFRYNQINYKNPHLIFIENQGIFIGADTADELQLIYDQTISRLKKIYDQSGLLNPDFPVERMENDTIDNIKMKIRSIQKNQNLKVQTIKRFENPTDPVTPDQVVYCKSFPFTGDLSEVAIENYQKQYGYSPKVFIWGNYIFTVGKTDMEAQTSMDMIIDSAMVKHYSQAFGGVNYLSVSSREFLETWESENYRVRVLSDSKHNKEADCEIRN